MNAFDNEQRGTRMRGAAARERERATSERDETRQDGTEFTDAVMIADVDCIVS